MVSKETANEMAGMVDLCNTPLCRGYEGINNGAGRNIGYDLNDSGDTAITPKRPGRGRTWGRDVCVGEAAAGA